MSDEELKIRAYRFLLRRVYRLIFGITLICIVTLGLGVFQNSISYVNDTSHARFIMHTILFILAKIILAISLILILYKAATEWKEINVVCMGHKGIMSSEVKTVKIKVAELYKNYYCLLLSDLGELCKTYTVCYVKYIDFANMRLALEISDEAFEEGSKEQQVEVVKDEDNKCLKHTDTQENAEEVGEVESDGSKED